MSNIRKPKIRPIPDSVIDAVYGLVKFYKLGKGEYTLNFEVTESKKNSFSVAKLSIKKVKQPEVCQKCNGTGTYIKEYADGLGQEVRCNHAD